MSDPNKGSDIEFIAEMVNGDEVHVRVTGHTTGESAIRALIQAGSPDNIMPMIRQFKEEGDLSMVKLAADLGAFAEKRRR